VHDHVVATDGGAFVLFTSFSLLNRTAQALEGGLRAMGMDVFVHGKSGARGQILEDFRRSTRGVLFGAASFWQGVDVRGDALRNVIITRLPFDPPERPVVEARGERIRERGGDPFRDDALPRAVIRFKQGFGRLIRSAGDRGRVVVLDPRILTTGYGRAFLEAVPPGVVVKRIMLGRVFKAYDIRGTYPDLLNERWPGRSASALEVPDPGRQGGGRDHADDEEHRRRARHADQQPSLSQALIQGINDHGGNVIDVGMVDTSMIYFAVNHLDCAGGVMVTASHNPPQYNGFKVSKRKAKPVGEATGLADVRKHAAMVDKATAPRRAGQRIEQRDLWLAYAKHVRSFLDLGGSRSSRS
jgi:hypothetical protein